MVEVVTGGVALGARRVTRYDLGIEDLSRLLGDEPAFRARQLHSGLYEGLAEPDAIHVLPSALRARVAAMPELASALSVASELRADRDQTVKWLFELDDHRFIETVLMHYPSHSTVCISSQAGCAMACQFCATGDAGFFRHLSVGEIVEQVVRAARAAWEDGRRLDNIVFMGMGEPMANFARVWTATERIINDLGIGARHLTISTVGIVPGIDALAGHAQQVNLAVSLHAANDELRTELVPINRRYPLEALRASLHRYREATRRRVSLEWALMEGVNDRTRDANELAAFALDLGAHVNLIPLNPTAGGLSRGLRGTPRAGVLRFRDELVRLGVNATIRRTRGQEIDAACGQLAGALATAVKTPTTRARD